MMKSLAPLLFAPAGSTSASAKKASSTQRPEGPSTLLPRTGTVAAAPKGFGFVTTEDGQEFFVPPALMRECMTGDLVAFDTEPGKRPGTFQVSRISLRERKAAVWLGTLREDGGAWVLDTDEPCFVRIELPELKFGAAGLVVAVRTPALKYSGRGPAPRAGRVTGQLERVLGERSRSGFDIDYALARHDFGVTFPSAVRKECQNLPAAAEPGAAHEDLQSIPFVTIDGEQTRDFDDAVWAQATDSGWHVMVAIADVSHYVRPGSALDREARARGTSVYLPGKTVPMLPEALSNGLCSLVPNELRLAVVLDIDLDGQGQVQGVEVRRAAIKSAQRLTYDQVHAWSKGELALSDRIEQSMKALWQVYEVLSSLRRDRGQLEFDDREPKLSGTGTEQELSWSRRNDAHKLVEELMLLGNQCVARLLKGRDVGLFRHQPVPDAERWAMVSEWAAERGIELPREPSMKALSSLVESMKGDETLKAELRVRNSMRPASYDARQPSHFSLGYEAYSHFTSPIRRYADLLVHRLLLGDAGSESEASDWAETVEHCSTRSRDARMAERWVWDKIKKRTALREAEAMGPAGQSLAAHVVLQSRRGLRVVLDQWMCSALLGAEQLLEDGYAFDDVAQRWASPEACFDLGSLLQVRLLRMEEDKARSELHVALCDETAQEGS